MEPPIGVPNPMGQVPDLVSVGAAAIVQNADRFGLTWTLRTGTVLGVSGTTVVGRLDGDTAPLNMTSTIGPVYQNDRVYVLIVPPSGVFIMGWVDTSKRFGAFAQKITLVSRNDTSFILTPLEVCVSVVVDWTLRNTTGGFQAGVGLMRISNDAAASYGYRYIQAAGATASALAHTQAFGTTSAIFSIYPTAGATSGRFGSGRIIFPAWNQPHSSQLGYTFVSSFENGTNDGWYLTGGGLYGGASPYTSINLFPTADSWAAGSQVYATGFVTL